MSTSDRHMLIVGGNGFIGSYVAARAVGMGWRVTSLSTSPPQSPLDEVSYLSADISSKAELEKAIGGTSFTHVVNCGGYVDHTLYESGGRRVVEAHFSGVLNLVDVLDRTTLAGFVNIGSADEYGSAATPQSETTREAPISPYSLGKAAATHFLQMLNRTEGYPAATLRIFLAYGPGQKPNRFLPQIISGCLAGKSFPTSAGEQLRDFCYIDDIVSAIFLALDTAAAHGKVINIASGNPVSIRRMIEAVRNIVGSGAPQIGAMPYRKGENMAVYADTAAAKTVLGWSPQTSLEAGLAKTIDWFRQQS